MKLKSSYKLNAVWIASVVVNTALFFSTPSFAQDAPESKRSVPTANFTTFSDKDLGTYLAENLKPEIQQAVRERGLVVVATAWTFNFDSGSACFASVGLADAPTKGRNPRRPQFRANAYQVKQKEDCAASSIRDAVASLNSTTLDEISRGLQKTFHSGGTRALEAADSDMVTLNTVKWRDYDTGPLFKKLHAFNLGKAVDHRHVVAAVLSSSFRFDDGDLLCFAEAGFAGRAPDGRNARIPSSRNATAVLREKGSQADCEQHAAFGAIEQLMKDPWVGEKGRFNDFERAREDGIPLPDLKRVAEVEKRLIAASQPVQRVVESRSTQVNRLSCTNQCVNGDCIRTFSNGTKERWQAPRRYNSMSGNWEWDTSSCGG